MVKVVVTRPDDSAEDSSVQDKVNEYMKKQGFDFSIIDVVYQNRLSIYTSEQKKRMFKKTLAKYENELKEFNSSITVDTE